MDKHKNDALLQMLVSELNRNMMTGLNSEIIFSTRNEELTDVKEKTKHLVRIGASNLKRTVPHLRRLGYNITEVTCPGRVTSSAGIREIQDQLKGTLVPAHSTVVMDLFGNNSFRWELTYPNPSLHLINFFGREGNINLT